MKKTIEAVVAHGNLSEELRESMRANEIKNRWKRNLIEKYCTPKQIRLYMKELRNDGKLPLEKHEYKPNYKGIQCISLKRMHLKYNMSCTSMKLDF
jgi:hypothetical protein